MTNQTSVVYAKNEIKLSWLIRSSAVYDKNQQENSVIYHNGSVYTKKKLNFHDQLDQVSIMAKTR